MKKAWLLASLVLALSWIGGAALAQETGGSFGGGSFGGGSSGGGYSGGGYSGGGYRSSYGSSYGSGSGEGGETPWSCVGPCIGLWLVLSLVAGYRRARGLGPIRWGAQPTHGARAWASVDVSAVQIAIDWRARRELQAKLDALAKSGQTGTNEGLASLLRETLTGVRQAQLSWLYASIVNHHPMSAAMAEGIFRQLGVDARSRFERELVRSADGATATTDAPELRTRSDEGEGVVVVTIIVAARREIADIEQHADAARIAQLLDELMRVAEPQSLVALEVVWSPAAENDRMSTAELETLYPQLRKIDEASVAGRVFCAHCRGPFAAELAQCPHCGAPIR